MTPKAQAALADYLAMGPGRSLEKLCEVYVERRRSVGAEAVPTTRLPTLQKWSSEYNWQEEALAYEQRMAEALETEAAKARKRRLKIVQSAIGILVEGMQEKGGKRKFKAESVRDLEALVKLEAQLLGEPLADRHELTGKDGGPIATAGVVTLTDLVNDDEGRELLLRVAARLCPVNGDAADPSAHPDEG